MTNQFSKVAEYKIQIQKSVEYQKEEVKIIMFTMGSRKNKIIRNKFKHKCERTVYHKKRTLLVETEECRNKWKYIPCSQIAKTNNIVKIYTLLK